MKSSQGNLLQNYTDWGMSPKVLLSIRKWLSQFDHHQKGRIWSLHRAKYIPSTVNLRQSGRDFISHIRDHLQFCLNRGIVPQSLIISESPLKENFFKSSTNWGKSRHWGMISLFLSESPLKAWSRDISSYSEVSQARSRLLASTIPSQVLLKISIIRQKSKSPAREGSLIQTSPTKGLVFIFPCLKFPVHTYSIHTCIAYTCM